MDEEEHAGHGDRDTVAVAAATSVRGAPAIEEVTERVGGLYHLPMILAGPASVPVGGRPEFGPRCPCRKPLRRVSFALSMKEAV